MTRPDPASLPPITRNAALDAARGILMMLGVLLHTANIYTLDGSWLVSDSQRNGFFDLLVEAIHTFRMPAFFWISGYFCALTFERNGAQGLLHKRLPRLAVPLLATWLTLNVAQVFLLATLKGDNGLQALGGGVPLFHLWFLVDLLFYIGIAALLLPHMRHFSGTFSRLAKLPAWGLMAFFAVITVALNIATRLTGIAYDSPFGLTSLYRLASYAPYFAVGIFMYRHAHAREAFLRMPYLLLLVALPLAVVADRYTSGQSRLVNEAALLAYILLVWVSIAVVLRLFHDFVRRDSPLTRFLSDIAYTVYLFHHIIVVLLGYLLIRQDWGAGWKFLVITSVSLAATILIHVLLIQRVPVLRRLFNGK